MCPTTVVGTADALGTHWVCRGTSLNIERVNRNLRCCDKFVICSGRVGYLSTRRQLLRSRRRVKVLVQRRLQTQQGWTCRADLVLRLARGHADSKADVEKLLRGTEEGGRMDCVHAVKDAAEDMK